MSGLSVALFHNLLCHLACMFSFHHFTIIMVPLVRSLLRFLSTAPKGTEHLVYFWLQKTGVKSLSTSAGVRHCVFVVIIVVEKNAMIYTTVLSMFSVARYQDHPWVAQLLELLWVHHLWDQQIPWNSHGMLEKDQWIFDNNYYSHAEIYALFSL